MPPPEGRGGGGRLAPTRRHVPPQHGMRAVTAGHSSCRPRSLVPALRICRGRVVLESLLMPMLRAGGQGGQRFWRLVGSARAGKSAPRNAGGRPTPRAHRPHLLWLRIFSSLRSSGSTAPDSR